MAIRSGKFIVLGGTGGIGGALAKRLLGKGYQVHVIGRDPAKLQELAALFRVASSPMQIETSQADVTDTPALESAVKAVGPIRGLAYCVGSIQLRPLKATKTEDFIQAFMLNTIGAATAIRAALPGMQSYHKETGDSGSVVLFSTVAVRQGFPNHAIISAAKGGVEGLVRSLASELAPAIRVNGVAPSLTDTPMASVLTKSAAMRDAIGKQHPIPRIGNSDDAAAAAAYLLDPLESSWVTGQIIGVDGGRGVVRR